MGKGTQTSGSGLMSGILGNISSINSNNTQRNPGLASVFKRRTPAEHLKALEWPCKFCAGFKPESEEAKYAGKPFTGHKEDCRWLLEMVPRIAYLMLCEKGEE